MIRLTSIALPIDHNDHDMANALAERLDIARTDIIDYRIAKKSIDARKGSVFFVYTIDVSVADQQTTLQNHPDAKNIAQTPDRTFQLPTVSRKPDHRPVIVGSGPAGLFAALLLAKLGLNPILLERGKPAIERAKDVAAFWRTGQLDPNSNVQFGQGGAGTFSDGKLTTQIKDRHNRVRFIIDELIAAGAPEEIAFLSKPHIGTDILIEVVINITNRIESLGGTVRFNACVTDINIQDSTVKAAILASGESIPTNHLVLAIGHSARDTFQMLCDRDVELHQKPFAIGLRIEHPQSLIDTAQYGKHASNPALGPAAYKLAHHNEKTRSAYTFCMCPGGRVIASSSEPGSVVTNGMSSFARSLPNANAALLVGIHPKDFNSDHRLAGIHFQRFWEQKAFEIAGSNYKAPAQLVADFLNNRPSKKIGDVTPTYAPGIELCNLANCLPTYVTKALRAGIYAFDKKLKGFARPDAVLTAIESRSSSPVRIPRDNTTLQSISTKGLYPTGEGPGYAGGIISAAVDGMKTAQAIAKTVK